MVNVYMRMELMNHIMPMQFKDTIGHEVMSDLTIEIIDDMPITGVIRYSDNGESIMIFMRDEMMTQSQLYAAGGIDDFREDNSIKLKVGNGQILALLHDLAWNINTFLFNNDYLAQAEGLDPEQSGILLTMDAKGLKADFVSGKERPDLLCSISTGSQMMIRPYKDDVKAKSEIDMMPLGEKIAAAEAGDELLMEKLAVIYMNGDEETEADPVKAVYWFEKMAEKGIPFAWFNLGLLYAKGYGVERDFEKAASWMEKAAGAGDEEAKSIAARYRKMTENRLKAEEGDTQAQAELAAELMKLGGSLVGADSEKDFKESVKWARLAAG